MAQFDVSTFDVQKYHQILDRGLSLGLGEQGRQVCIEAAICEALGLPHGDDPKCVAASVRRFKIRLNDSTRWSSPMARANGLRDLGLAQLGSLGVVNDVKFAKEVAGQTIRLILPKLLRTVRLGTEAEAIAVRCEQEGTYECAKAARQYYADVAAYADVADVAAVAAVAAAAAADDAAYADDAADAADAAAAGAADAGADAAYAAADESFLLLSAQIGLSALRKLGSPGVALLDRVSA
jgi:hypothetical protein